MRRMMIAATACVLVAGLVALAQDPTTKPVQPAQPVPKAVQPVPKAVQPAQPILPRVGTVTALKMAQLEEDFEMVEAQREVKKAYVKAAEVALEGKKGIYEQLLKIAANNLTSEVRAAKFEFDMAQAQLEIKLAELKETEVKVKHSKKRLDDAKLGGVRPVPPIVRPVDPKAVDPLPQVRFVADEKEVAELKVKLAKVQEALAMNAAEAKKAEEQVKVAEAELAKAKNTAMLGRVTADFIPKFEAKVKEAKDALAKVTKEGKALEAEAAAIQKKLKEIGK